MGGGVAETEVVGVWLAVGVAVSEKDSDATDADTVRISVAVGGMLSDWLIVSDTVIVTDFDGL